VPINGTLISPWVRGQDQITQILTSSTGSDASWLDFPATISSRTCALSRAHGSRLTNPRPRCPGLLFCQNTASPIWHPAVVYLSAQFVASSSASQLMMRTNIIPRHADGVKMQTCKNLTIGRDGNRFGRVHRLIPVNTAMSNQMY
jgi:hypothetical protein